MPSSPKTICPGAGCRAIVPTGTRCEKHRTHRGESKNRSGDPFYNSKEWHRLRDWKRTVNPLCEDCELEGKATPMAEVDHVLPRSTHPELELDADNLRSLCKMHHSRKTMKERHHVRS